MKKFLLLSVKNILNQLILFLLSSTFLQAQNISLVKEINIAVNGSSTPNNFTLNGGKLYFFASDNGNFNTLWVTQGTAATTQKLGPAGATANSVANIEKNLTSFNSNLFFSYDDGINGQEVWTSDGTPAGTVLFKDINPGISSSQPQAFTVCNSKLFFAALQTDGVFHLFASDGTPAGTTELRKVYVSGGQSGFAILNNDIYFIGDDGTGSGFGLWKSDGTLAGTILLIPNLISAAGIPGFSARLNAKLYFSATDNITGTELWVTDGSTAGTHLVKDIGITVDGNPQKMIVYNNKIYFSARDDLHGLELFASDGTEAGTQIVKDINVGTGGSQPFDKTVYNGLLYFGCNGSELWKTDGTDAGTQLVKGSLFAAPTFAATWNNKMYILLLGANTGIWESDGTTAGTKPIQLQNTTFPVTSYTDFGGDKHFTGYNTELYFNGTSFNITNGFEPVKLSLAGPLPVTWLGVQAQWQNTTQAKISWQVAEEQNVKEYTVQHSTDATTYTDVCRVIATDKKDYNCIVAANTTKNYYRVLEVDIDGRKSYSKLVFLQAALASIVKAYPNPAKDILYVDGLQNYQSLIVADMMGRIVMQQKILPAPHSINVSILSKGSYVLKLKNNTSEETLKFSKQ